MGVVPHLPRQNFRTFYFDIVLQNRPAETSSVRQFPTMKNLRGNSLLQIAYKIFPKTKMISRDF